MSNPAKIDDVLKAVSDEDEDAMIPRPATDEDIKLCNEDFAECGLGLTLPDEYAAFLKKANGFAWNGIELFGTDMVTDTETDFTLIDIVSENEDFQQRYNEEYYDWETLKSCFYFGHVDDDMYVYNTAKKSKRWQVMDIGGGDPYEEYDTFEEFFVNVIGGYL